MVEVVVVQESHFPPKISDPKLFFVIVSKPYVVTNIGEVKVVDRDENDVHQFQITAGNEKGIFSIQEMRGVIEGKPSKGIYNLSVEVTDGKFSDSGVFRIIVNELDDEVRVKSVLVKFEGIDVNTFLAAKVKGFIERLAKMCGTSFENVFIWSLQSVEGKSGDSKKIRVKRTVAGGGTRIALAVLKMNGEVSNQMKSRTYLMFLYSVLGYSIYTSFLMGVLYFAGMKKKSVILYLENSLKMRMVLSKIPGLSMCLFYPNIFCT